MGLKLITPPATTSVTVDEFKQHQRITDDFQNDEITDALFAADELIGEFLNRQLVKATYEMALDQFPSGNNNSSAFSDSSNFNSGFNRDTGQSIYSPSRVNDTFYMNGTAIILPKSPMDTVNSIKYLDRDGVQQTLSASEYTTDNFSEPARIVPAPDKYYPETQETINAVIINYDCGYATIADIPRRIKQAVKLLVGHWYENRESTISGVTISEIPQGVKSILWSIRVKTFTVMS